MNPDYFRKLFKKEMGVSPLKYLTQIRISHAKRLLRLKQRSDMSIQEIAWLSGFQDSLYFSRVFKKGHRRCTAGLAMNPIRCREICRTDRHFSVIDLQCLFP